MGSCKGEKFLVYVQGLGSAFWAHGHSQLVWLGAIYEDWRGVYVGVGAIVLTKWER